jgi:hypothetical protein
MALAHSLGKVASSLIHPGTYLVVDESLYEFNGVCPVRRYVPRKPHPNGLLVYGLAGYFHVGQSEIPYVLDFEPYTLDNLVSAQNAMMELFRRLRLRRPLFRPHLVVDSAFGSFDRLAEIVAGGGDATMSMVPTVKPWLWELLDFHCGIDTGRLAYFPNEDIVVSSFKVMSEAGNEHQIKTISSGCRLVTSGDEEEIVVQVRDRREGSDGSIEYLTDFRDGHSEWLLARDFIDDDGTTNLSWLSFVDSADLVTTFGDYTHQQLKV